MTAVVSLAGIRAIRRKDSYSLAARALVAKALGLDVGEDLRLPPFQMGEQPSAHVRSNIEYHLTFEREVPTLVAKIATPIFAVIQFNIATAAIPWILESIDNGETIADAVESCDFGDIIMYGCDPFADAAQELAATVHGDEKRRWRLLYEAWKEVAAFLRRAWPEIEALAVRLQEGETIPAGAIPRLPWKHSASRPKAAR